MDDDTIAIEMRPYAEGKNVKTLDLNSRQTLWNWRGTLAYGALLLGLTAGCNEDTEGSEHRADLATNEALPQTIAIDKSMLWCGVKQIADSKCNFCHDGKGTAGAPMSLLTQPDYLKPAPLTKPKTVYEAVALRVHDKAKPMPPAGLLDAPSLKAIDDWVDAGAPPGPDGGCPSPDAGTLSPSR